MDKWTTQQKKFCSTHIATYPQANCGYVDNFRFGLSGLHMGWIYLCMGRIHFVGKNVLIWCNKLNERLGVEPQRTRSEPQRTRSEPQRTRSEP